MGDRTQLKWVLSQKPQLDGPFLEVGSRNYGSTQDLRQLFAERGDYVGVDMLDGDGVDVVLDLCQDFDDIDRVVDGRRFGTIFCLSVMEHCDQPFDMAANLTKLLKPGGRLVISAPFAWKFHGYPSDFWRFTHEGVRKLFPDIEFSDADAYVASDSVYELDKPQPDMGKIHLSPGAHRRNGRWIHAIGASILRGLTMVGLTGWLTSHRYVMAPTNIFMVGSKRMTASKAA